MALRSCREAGCVGEIVDGRCRLCGTAAPAVSLDDDAVRKEVMQSVRSLLTSRTSPSKEDLHQACQRLNTIVPYNYEAWRLHADLLLQAIAALGTRQLEPDETCTLFVTPLREEQLRDAAELALRQCAHFADSSEKRIALIDEANSVRRTTWI